MKRDVADGGVQKITKNPKNDRIGDDPAGVYIHIPFCKSKCSYCDFRSVPGKEYLIEDYTRAVISEIRNQSAEIGGREIVSIFFGGGTPSLVPAYYIGKIILACSRCLKLAPNTEITMEMNPDSVTEAGLSEYKAAGVNRVSIGVQSLRDDRLRTLERVHTAVEALAAVENAGKAGFGNISVDMMFGLPGQTVDDWTEELGRITATGVTHISCYEITAEPGTALADSVRRGIVELRPDDTASLFDTAETFLESAGFSHYEISNYARPGFECVHNMGYWEYRDYLGIGAGAHSAAKQTRWENLWPVEEYIASVKNFGHAVKYSERLTRDIRVLERLMLGLRLKKGVSLKDISPTSGMRRMIESGILLMESERILKASPQGWRLLNNVLAEL